MVPSVLAVVNGQDRKREKVSNLGQVRSRPAPRTDREDRECAAKEACRGPATAGRAPACDATSRDESVPRRTSESPGQQRNGWRRAGDEYRQPVAVANQIPSQCFGGCHEHRRRHGGRRCAVKPRWFRRRRQNQQPDTDPSDGSSRPAPGSRQIGRSACRSSVRCEKPYQLTPPCEDYSELRRVSS